MDPKIIEVSISAAVHLIEFLMEARKNGQLTDAQLAQFTKTTNSQTRALIAQALGVHPPA